MIFLTLGEWSIWNWSLTIWQGVDEWFTLLAEGEQHWDGGAQALTHTADCECSIGTAAQIEIVVSLTIALLILYYWNTTSKAINKVELNQTLLTSAEHWI